jgi:antitoxin ParD1/3/4
MTNSLTPDLASFVANAVSAGKYDSPEAVVAAGLRLLQEQEQEFDDLRRKVQEGIDEIDRGEFIEITSSAEMQEFFEDIKRRYRERSRVEKAG